MATRHLFSSVSPWKVQMTNVVVHVVRGPSLGECCAFTIRSWPQVWSCELGLSVRGQR